jgi:hypothetical protein
VVVGDNCFAAFTRVTGVSATHCCVICIGASRVICEGGQLSSACCTAARRRFFPNDPVQDALAFATAAMAGVPEYLKQKARRVGEGRDGPWK